MITFDPVQQGMKSIILSDPFMQLSKLMRPPPSDARFDALSLQGYQHFLDVAHSLILPVQYPAFETLGLTNHGATKTLDIDH